MSDRSLTHYIIERTAFSLLLGVGIVLVITGIVIQLFTVYPTNEFGQIIWMDLNHNADPSFIWRFVLSIILIISGIAVTGFFLFNSPQLSEETAVELLEYDRRRQGSEAPPKEKHPTVQLTKKCLACGAMNEEEATYCIRCANPLISKDQIRREKSEKEKKDFRRERLRRRTSDLASWLLFVEAVVALMVTVANLHYQTTGFETIGWYSAALIFIYLISWAFLMRPDLPRVSLALILWGAVFLVLVFYTDILENYLTG